MRVATEPVAWLHKTGHNEIQFLYGIFSRHDKVLHMVLPPCTAVPSKANSLKILTEVGKLQLASV